MIKEIRDITKQADRSHAIIFFFYFARFEYALKRSGFITNKNDAQPDWDAFAKKHASLALTEKDPKFVAAVVYFRESPPKKQAVTSAGLDWVDDKYCGSIDLPRLLVLVRRVRNNLFHGGKFQSGIATEISRDKKLLESSLSIMESCLPLEPDVRYHFSEGLFW